MSNLRRLVSCDFSHAPVLFYIQWYWYHDNVIAFMATRRDLAKVTLLDTERMIILYFLIIALVTFIILGRRVGLVENHGRTGEPANAM